MGPQILLIPALFVLICATFIFLHSCYYRWKIGNAFRKKREAAKISLVNILQMTNPSLITPSWMSQKGEKSSKILKSSSPSSGNFDPRNPKVLSSDATLMDNNTPPPCYEDLFGSGEIAFVYCLESNADSASPQGIPTSTMDCNAPYDRYGGQNQHCHYQHQVTSGIQTHSHNTYCQNSNATNNSSFNKNTIQDSNSLENHYHNINLSTLHL